MCFGGGTTSTLPFAVAHPPPPAFIQVAHNTAMLPFCTRCFCVTAHHWINVTFLIQPYGVGLPLSLVPLICSSLPDRYPSLGETHRSIRTDSSNAACHSSRVWLSPCVSISALSTCLSIGSDTRFQGRIRRRNLAAKPALFPEPKEGFLRTVMCRIDR